MLRHDKYDATPDTHTEFLDGQRLLGALADATRRAIFNLLLEQPQPVKVLAADLPISQPAVSQHLKTMLEAGLVTKTPQGRYHIYGVNPVALDWLSVQFGALREDVLNNTEESQGSLILEEGKDPVDSVMAQWAAIGADYDPLAMGVVVRMFLAVHHMKLLTEKACAPYGISFPERHLLNMLHRLQLREATLAQLASGSLLPLTTTALHLKRLEQLGFVKLSVSEGEKALNLISITQRGLETLHTIRQHEQEHEFSALYRMSPQDLKQLETLLRSLLHGLQETLQQAE